MKAKPAIFLLFIITSMACAGQAYGQTPQYLDEFGASCKSIGMGQAFTAVADDFSAAYYNPAGLTQTDSLFAFTIGYFYSKPNAEAIFFNPPFRYDNDFPTKLKQPSSHGAIVGMASNFEIESVIKVLPMFRRLAYGMTFFMHLPNQLTYDIGPENYRPHYFRYDEGYALMSLALALGFEVTPWFSFGTGGFLSQNAYANEEVFSAQNKSNTLPGAVPDRVIGTRLSIWSRAKSVWIPSAGLLLKPPVKSLQDKISLGACWRAKNEVVHADGYMNVIVGTEDEFGQPNWGILFVSTPMGGIVGFQPAQYSVALAVRPMEGLLLSADATWKEWSEYIDYRKDYPYPKFKNVIVPRVGLEYAFDPDFSFKFLKGIERIAVREGYFYEPTPVWTIDYDHNIFDTNKHVLSMGLQLDFRSRQGRMRHSVETYGQVHLFEERRVSNTYETRYGVVDLKGYVYALGASITTKF